MSPVAGAIVAIILFVVIGAATGWALALSAIASIALDRVKQGVLLWALGALVWLAAIGLTVWQAIHLITLLV